MARLAMNALLAGAALVCMAAALAGDAQAYESALDACRKWTGEGAGMQYKCFDCMKLVGSGPYRRWVNTCPEYYGYAPPLSPPLFRAR